MEAPTGSSGYAPRKARYGESDDSERPGAFTPGCEELNEANEEKWDPFPLRFLL